MMEVEKKQALYEELKRLPRPDEGACWEKCPYCGKTVWFAERVTSVHCDHCRKLIPIELLLPPKKPEPPKKRPWYKRLFRAK